MWLMTIEYVLAIDCMLCGPHNWHMWLVTIYCNFVICAIYLAFMACKSRMRPCYRLCVICSTYLTQVTRDKDNKMLSCY